jgi:hypothetical protein
MKTVADVLNIARSNLAVRAARPSNSQERRGRRALPEAELLTDIRALIGDTARLDLLNRLRALADVTLSTSKINGWPGVPLADMRRDEVWLAVQAIVREVRSKVITGAKA